MGFPISHSQKWRNSCGIGGSSFSWNLSKSRFSIHSSFAAAVVLSQRPDDKVIPSIVVNTPERSHVSSALGGFSYDTSIALERVSGRTLPPLFVCLLGWEQLDTVGLSVQALTSAETREVSRRVRGRRHSPEKRQRGKNCRGCNVQVRQKV